MDKPETAEAGPPWDASATRMTAFWRGVRETPVVPALILTSAFIGFGALTRQTGLSILDTIYIAMFMFALPGQVVLVDEMARGASVATAALAVTATGVRLLPMTVVLMPMIRSNKRSRLMDFAVAYFVAVTVWVESMRRAPHVPRDLRSAYCLGISLWLVFVSTMGAIAGFLLASNVPLAVSAALLFMTPLYFLLGMLIPARSVTSLAPILFGLVLGPVFHTVTPDFDLILTGIIGGSAAVLLSALLKRSRTGR